MYVSVSHPPENTALRNSNLNLSFQTRQSRPNWVFYRFRWYWTGFKRTAYCAFKRRTIDCGFGHVECPFQIQLRLYWDEVIGGKIDFAKGKWLLRAGKVLHNLETVSGGFHSWAVWHLCLLTRSVDLSKERMWYLYIWMFASIYPRGKRKLELTSYLPQKLSHAMLPPLFYTLVGGFNKNFW